MEPGGTNGFDVIVDNIDPDDIMMGFDETTSSGHEDQASFTEEGHASSPEESREALEQIGHGADNQRAYPLKKVLYEDRSVQVYIQRDNFRSTRFRINDHMYTIRAHIKEHGRIEVPTVKACLSAIVEGISEIIKDLQAHYAGHLDRQFNLVFYEKTLDR